MSFLIIAVCSKFPSLSDFHFLLTEKGDKQELGCCNWHFFFFINGLRFKHSESGDILKRKTLIDTKSTLNKT